MRWPAKMISYLTSTNGIIVFLNKYNLTVNLVNFFWKKWKRLEDDIHLITMFLRHDIVADIQWPLVNETWKTLASSQWKTWKTLASSQWKTWKTLASSQLKTWKTLASSQWKLGKHWPLANEDLEKHWPQANENLKKHWPLANGNF